MRFASISRVSILAFALVPAGARAAEWHVTTDGTPDGDGSEAAPWDVVTAWAHPASVQPGDTIWLHGGTYAVMGGLWSSLAGTSDAPIVVRGRAGERVTFDTGASASNGIYIGGAYTWFWDFEVMSSAEDRWADDGNAADRGYSIDVANSEDAPGIKLIDLVVHDTQGAIGFWSGTTDAPEVYGCLIYFNGYDFDDRGHGHGIYTQNVDGPKYLRDNIIFGQYSHGIHAYTEGGQINDFVMEGNISFENGVVSTITGRTRNLLVGGVPIAESPQLRENYTWFDRTAADGTACDIGYGAGVSNVIAEANVCVSGGLSFRVLGPVESIAGNTFVGPTDGLDMLAWPNNDVYPDGPPTGSLAFVRPNAYDTDRAHVVVFNWDAADSVDVDLSPLLGDGDEFVLLDAQNYYGDPVLAGIYDGAVAVPMTPGETASVVGTPATPYVHTSAEFGAFVLVRTAMGPGGTGIDSGGGVDSGSGDGSTAGATGSTSVGGADDTITATATGGGTSGPTGEDLDPTRGMDNGCGCRTNGRASLPWLALVLVALRRRVTTRRRSAARGSCRSRAARSMP